MGVMTSFGGKSDAGWGGEDLLTLNICISLCFFYSSHYLDTMHFLLDHGASAGCVGIEGNTYVLVKRFCMPGEFKSKTLSFENPKP